MMYSLPSEEDQDASTKVTTRLSLVEVSEKWIASQSDANIHVYVKSILKLNTK